MSLLRIRFLIVAITLLAIGGWAKMQSPQIEKVPPRIISGNDLGFRLEGRHGAKVVGTFVIRVAGEWIEVEAAARARPTQ
jgi:hypothetical protein